MKKSLLQRILMTLALLFGAMSAASAADRFYMDAVNIEPGETRTLAFNLENENPYFGFQGDLKLPEGLEVVTESGKPSITLSSRADNSFQIVSNTLADGSLRFGTFSTSHSSFSGNSGALLYLKVKATAEFAGGELSVKEILFIGSGDKDVVFPNISVSLGTEHNDKAFIPDFKIAVGEARQISLELSNETSFTAFQMDVVLPEGLTIQENSFRLSQRASDHTVSAKSFSDGRTRIACMSLTNAPFSGNSGALVSFTVIADKDIAEKSEMQLKNVLFTMPNAREYSLANSVTGITSERALVESITLSPSEITMIADGSTSVIQATVLPVFASTKELDWSSNAPEIASVSQAGVVSAKIPGTAVITASAVDGSGVTATCNVTVKGVPVTAVVLNRSTASLKVGESVALSATVLPANATDKSIIWSSSDESIATVDQTGIVNAIAIGTATIKATSVSNPEFSEECLIAIVPTPVTGITLSQSSVSIKVGGSVKIDASVLPESATNKAIVWTVTNPEIALVDENGVVTGLALGTTNLTATAADNGGASAICVVNVIPVPTESITIDSPEQTFFKAGETIQLSATVLPENASDKTVSWTSSDNQIFTVDANGLATAVSVGEVVMTATSSAGQKATVTLTVVPTITESIGFSSAEVSMEVGETFLIQTVVEPTNITNPLLRWVSTAPSVVSVDENGLLTAHAIGEVTVSATTTDGSDLTASCTVRVNPTPVESVRIVYVGPTTIKVGDVIQLGVEVKPDNATDRSVEWLVLDEKVLTITREGELTAVGPGESTVIARSSNGPSAEVTFVVEPLNVESIEIEPKTASLKVGEILRLSAKVMPANASDQSIIWESENPNVATVDADGVVTAVGLGSIGIKARANDGSGVVGSMLLSVVTTSVESISITAHGPTELRDGETLQLTATVLPETASDKSVYWSSNASALASVDENGLVSAHSYLGEVEIYAYAGNCSDRITLTIVPTTAAAISISPTTAGMKVSDTMQLSVSLTPETTTDKTLQWESSDPSIVSVNSGGLMTAHAIGKATVSATTTDGSNLTASCFVSVTPVPVEAISLDQTDLKLSIGEQAVLNCTITPDNSTVRAPEWSSSDETVATVNRDGTVTAIKSGMAVISAQADGKMASCNVTVIATSLVWTQKFECEPSDRVELTAGNENYAEVSYRSVRPDGGFLQAQIENVDGKWYATFPTEGTYVLEAYFTDSPEVTSRKTFNVVSSDDLLYIDGIYYRYTDGNKNALKVVRGYNMYAGDYTIPSSVIGLDVRYIDNDAFAQCTELGKITITEGITEIRSGSFGNGSISAIDIPASVKVIGAWAFNALDEIDGHYSLMSISLRGCTPIAVSPAIFNGYINYDLCELHVPEGTSSLYAAADVWKDFKKIIDDLPGLVFAQDVEIILPATELTVDETMTAQAKISPDNVTDKSVTWSVSDPEIISADNNGLITALSPGKSYLYARTQNDITASVLITVRPVYVQGITIPSEITVEKGTQYEFKPVVIPENASNKTLVWECSNPVIGSFEGNVFKAYARGEVVGTCRATDGSDVNAECQIKVVTYAKNLTLNEHGLTLKENDTFQLTATVDPIDAVDSGAVIWQSSNSDAVTVDDNGLISAVAAGSAVITASTRNYPWAADECNITVTKASGVETVSIDDTMVIIDGKNIIVTGLYGNSIVRLMDMSGRLVCRQNCDGNTVRLNVAASGCYILSAGMDSLKIVIP